MFQKKYYKDFYGGTASIARTKAGLFRLRICGADGRRELTKEYGTFRGARIAMGRYSDGWAEKSPSTQDEKNMRECYCPSCGAEIQSSKGWDGKFYDGYCNKCDMPIEDAVFPDDEESDE